MKLIKAKIEKFVWRTAVSPKDKKLEESFDFTVKGMQINAQLHRVEEPHELVKGQRKKIDVAKYYMAKPVPCVGNKRKLLIVFPGRNLNFFQLDKMFYTKRFYNTRKLDDYDIATIVYPKTVYNLDELTDACILAIEQLVTKHNYSMEDVSIMGWCLGGYFATETLHKLAERGRDEFKFSNFVNNKSFSSINEFLYYLLPKHMRLLLKVKIVKENVRLWDNDACKSLQACNELFDNVFIVYSNNDKVIRNMSHFYRHINDYGLENVNVCEDKGRRSHFINWQFTADLINQKN